MAAVPVSREGSCVEVGRAGAGEHAPGGEPSPVLVIDGASLLGRECVARLVGARRIVIAGVRSLADAATLTATYGADLHPVGLDLDDPRSVELTLEEIARIADGMHLDVVHEIDPALPAPLESVFPGVPDRGRQDSCCAGSTLTRLLDRADRLVVVSSAGAGRSPDATLARALVAVRARRAARGEGEISLAWVSCSTPAELGEQLEAALRSRRAAGRSLGA